MRMEIALRLKTNTYILSFPISPHNTDAVLMRQKIDFYKRTCNKELFERWRKNKRGDLVAYLRSSANLSKEEMSLSIDRFRYWSASVAGIYLPQKEDKEAMRYIRQEIDRNRVYL